MEKDECKPAGDETGRNPAGYRALFENNHAAMLLVDPVSLDIVDANDAACNFYGWSREEITCRRIFDSIFDDIVEDEFQPYGIGIKYRCIFSQISNKLIIVVFMLNPGDNVIYCISYVYFFIIKYQAVRLQS